MNAGSKLATVRAGVREARKLAAQPCAAGLERAAVLLAPLGLKLAGCGTADGATRGEAAHLRRELEELAAMTQQAAFFFRYCAGLAALGTREYTRGGGETPPETPARLQLEG